LLRILLTYILLALAVLYVILSGLWLVPDSFAGMYGNYDGHWASWHARGILEWGRLLDFSPFSPFIGTGSLFPPNLPWLNPGALALAIPAPLPVRHFASMLVYLTELSVTLYLLYRHLDFAGTLVPRNDVVSLLIVYSPQRIPSVSALVRARARKCSLDRRDECSNYRIDPVGYDRLRRRLLFGVVYFGALFVAFASAPVGIMTYAPGLRGFVARLPAAVSRR
jgi:hypothetical protein